MRISDWSSDVCSSDLLARDLHGAVRRLGGELSHDGVPGIVADARQHLQDALEMSAQAAHRSLDFAERMRPQAESLAHNAGEVLKWTNGNDAAAVLARERSEEHTSELQSLMRISYAVFCLKKKKKTIKKK